MKKPSKFRIESWDDIKDKYFEILIPDLESAIEWMRKMGIKIIKRDEMYWLVFNEDKFIKISVNRDKID